MLDANYRQGHREIARASIQGFGAMLFGDLIFAK